MKELNLEHKLYRWVMGWCSLFDGLVSIISLGFVLSSLQYNLCLWYSKRQARKAREKFENAEFRTLHYYDHGVSLCGEGIFPGPALASQDELNCHPKCKKCLSKLEGKDASTTTYGS